MKFVSQYLGIIILIASVFSSPHVRANKMRIFHEFQSIFKHQKSIFSNFKFPDKIHFKIKNVQDLQVIGHSTIIVPSESRCNISSLKIQVSHEIGHLVFSQKIMSGNIKASKDYKKFIQLQSDREQLYLLYDQFAKLMPLPLDELKKVDHKINKINTKLNELNYISYFIFPLEELFSDLYTTILYNDPAVIKKSLRCYSELEASQRDYSQKPSLDYVPMDPYGHTDYMFFGYEFLNSKHFNNFSKQENLERLFKVILDFINHYQAKDYSFSVFNKGLVEIEYDHVKKN